MKKLNADLTGETDPDCKGDDDPESGNDDDEINRTVDVSVGMRVNAMEPYLREHHDGYVIRNDE